MRSTLIKYEWSDTKYCSHNYKEEMVFIHFTKLTEHTVSFISVSKSCKNCTVTGYETQSVIFASYCEEDFTDSRDKTDTMINYIKTLKLPSVRATSMNTFYARSNQTLALRPYWSNLNCLFEYSDCGVLCMDPVWSCRWIATFKKNMLPPISVYHWNVPLKCPCPPTRLHGVNTHVTTRT